MVENQTPETQQDSFFSYNDLLIHRSANSFHKQIHRDTKPAQNPGQKDLLTAFAFLSRTRAFQKRKKGSREWNLIKITKLQGP